MKPHEKEYSVRVSCSNCGHLDRMSIPHGQKITDRACPVCGCRTISAAAFSSPRGPFPRVQRR